MHKRYRSHALLGILLLAAFILFSSSLLSGNKAYAEESDPQVEEQSSDETIETTQSIVSLSLQMYNKHRQDSTNTLSPWFQISNTGDTAVDLSAVKIRYYFTADGDQAQNFWCDWSNVGSNNILATIDKMPVSMVGADSYLEIGFTSNTGQLEPGEKAELQCRIAKNDWSVYSQTNDYSFNKNGNGYGDWQKVALYLNGELIHGIEPSEEAPIPIPVTAVELRVENSQAKDKTNTLFPRYVLNNTGNMPINLSDAKIRYYYTVDGERPQNFWCDWSSAGTENVTGEFVKLQEPITGADYYIEIGFTQGVLQPGKSVEIHTRIAKDNWSDFRQSNDYSFTGSNKYTPWSKVTILVGGDMIWGDNNIFGKPHITGIVPSQNSNTLYWTPVDGATGYEIEADGNIIGTTSGTDFQHTGLLSGILHQYRVRAVSSALTGEWSDPAEKWTLPGMPSIQAEASETEVILAWDDVTGATGYDLEVDGNLIEDAASPFVHNGLLPGTIHNYRIRAKNSSGQGEWTDFFHKWTIPEKMQIFNLFALQDKIYVSWDVVPGASSYVVEADGSYISTDGLGVVVENLSPGTEYIFRIRAENESGSGEWSDQQIKWTLPDIPVGIVSQATETQITISWDDVTGATGYDIEVDGLMMEDQNSPFSHTELGFGTRHTYRIRAKNSSGSGFWTDPVEVWTLPGLVEGLGATPFQNDIIVQWNPVNGAAEYDIELDGGIIEQTSIPYIHTGLETGTLHSYRVRARNDSGVGVWSDEISLWTLPDVVSDISSAATQTTIRIEWGEVIGATGYDMEVDGALIENITSPYVHEGMNEGTLHTYRLRAKNSSGTGFWCDEIVVWTLPGIPEGLVLVPGETSLLASWGEVEGAACYDIEINGTLINGVANAFTISGLSPGREYNVRVRAKNDSGFGDWSAESSIRTLPVLIENINASASQSHIEFWWEQVTGADGYDIEIDGEIIENSISPYLLEGLDAGTKHVFQVRAWNSSGKGRWSEAMIKWTLPGMPENIATHPASSSIEITWDEVIGATGYDIEVFGTPVDTGGLNAYTHFNLNPNTQITYRIRAKNESGSGEWTPVIAEATLPGLSKHINVDTRDDEIIIAWDAVSGADYYDIEADGEIINGLEQTSYIHSGLMPNTQHSYRIRSGSSRGESEWSALISARTKFPAPDEILITSTSTEILVEWEAVNGAEGYEVEADGTNSIVTGTSYNHMGLEPNTSHTYRVRAINNDNTGIWSNQVEKSTNLSAPGNIKADRGSSHISINWDMVAGAAAYEVEVDGEIFQTGLSNSFTHEGLESSSTHTYRVRAWNREQPGEWSAAVAVHTLVGTPGSITTVSSYHDISLEWDTVEGASGYELTIDGKFADIGLATSYTHSGLEPNSFHVYRIRAKSAEGPGAWSESIVARTTVAVPAGLKAVVSSHKIILIWDEVSGADSYDVEINGQMFKTAESMFTCDGLDPNTPYAARVRASNEVGSSGWSDEISCVTSPEAPEIKVQATTNNIALEWNSVEGAVAYDLEIDGTPVENLTETSYVHEGLKSNSRHHYRIRSRNEDTASEWSKFYSVVTSPEIAVPLKRDVVFNFVMIVPEKPGVKERIVTVTYNPDELEVFDLCAVTPAPETGIGSVEGTNIEVVGFSPGKIVYKIKNAGRTVVNIIKFLANASGRSNVSYTIE